MDFVFKKSHEIDCYCTLWSSKAGNLKFKNHKKYRNKFKCINEMFTIEEVC